MLIGHSVKILVALIGLVATIHKDKKEYYNDTLSLRISKRSTRENRHRHVHEKSQELLLLSDRQTYMDRWIPYSHTRKLRFDPGKQLSFKENRELLQHDWAMAEKTNRSGVVGVDCCPSVLEMTEPEGGKNDKDEFVDLYKSDNYRQRFYELSCHKDVLNKACRFMDKKLHIQSRCIQMYSYTYALVVDTQGTKTTRKLPTFSGTDPGIGYTLDYIQVRSGCSCVVIPLKAKQKNNRKKKKFKSRIVEDE